MCVSALWKMSAHCYVFTDGVKVFLVMLFFFFGWVTLASVLPNQKIRSKANCLAEMNFFVHILLQKLWWILELWTFLSQRQSIALPFKTYFRTQHWELTSHWCTICNLNIPKFSTFALNFREKRYIMDKYLDNQIFIHPLEVRPLNRMQLFEICKIFHL